MPELPEVETIRRGLAELITGRRIEAVDIHLPRMVKLSSPADFIAMITGRTIRSVDRRGKYLLIWLDSDMVLVVHLRMTGRLYYMSSSEPAGDYARIVFYLNHGDQLVFSDTRTLGTIDIMHANELNQIHGLATMGPEPLSPEFTTDYLAKALIRSSAKVKSLLLNQQIIGGLGNIYVDESLALAGIHPERTGKSLSENEINRLFMAINLVITDALSHQGTTFRDYRDGYGKEGGHQNYLRVYGRKGEICQTCGQNIIRIEVGGRGTHFCPGCQH